MTPDALIAAAMDAQSANREQHLLVVNPSPEIDSLVEHVNALVRTATPAQKPHVHGIISIVRRLCESNSVELDCERLIAGAVESLDAAAKPWSFRRAVREIRDGRIADVASECPEEILIVDGVLNEKLAHEVGRLRADELWQLVLEQRVQVAA